MFKEILLENFITLSMIIGLTFVVSSNKTFEQRTNRYFMHFIGIVLLLCIADMGDNYMASLPTVNGLRYLTSSLGYTLRPASLAIIINILLRRRKVNIAVWVPVFAIAALTLTSRYTHLMFYFNAQNEFIRGPLGYLSHILSVIYMLAMAALTVRYHQTIDKGEFFIVGYIAVICGLATALESILHEKFLLPGAMIASCAVYYIFLYIQTYNRDALTGLLNRRSLYADAENMMHQHFIVVSMDLNGLKEINDTQGHQAGDLALRTLADICLSVSQKNYRVYRTGGDEFIALGKGKSAADAQEYIEGVRAALQKTPYMASFGFSQYSGNATFDDVCNSADSRMYDDKKHYRHRTRAEIVPQAELT